MVVGDDHVHAQGAGKVHLGGAGNAAVHGHQQPGPPVVEAADGLLPQAVAVLDAPGDIADAVRADGPQVVGEQTGGGDTVHVVVAALSMSFMAMGLMDSSRSRSRNSAAAWAQVTPREASTRASR